MRHLQLAFVAVCGAALTACDPPGETYSRPVGEVRELLRTVEVPLYMFGSSTETIAVVDASDPAKVMWKITSDTSPLMTFSATLVPDEDKTRVIVDLKGDVSNRYGDTEAKMAALDGVREFYIVSMTEAVDSTLEGRAYDITATYPAMMAATAANADKFFPPKTAGDDPS